MNDFEFVGYIGTVFGASILIPEIIRALRTHHLEDLAWGMLFLMLGASTSWFIYGLLHNNLTLMIDTIISISMQAILWTLKIHYSRAKMPLFPHKKLLKKKRGIDFIPQATLAKAQEK